MSAHYAEELEDEVVDPLAGLRSVLAQQAEAVASADRVMPLIIECFRARSGQAFRLRALLWSLYNGRKPVDLSEVLVLDWALKVSFCTVLMAFGLESPKASFFYRQLEEILEQHDLWEWFAEEGDA